MGTWFVHAHTPLVVDNDAVNPIEHYRLEEDGEIATTYQFRRNSPSGTLRTFTPKGSVHDHDTNAEWRMQFIWPIQASYLIIGLDEDYGGTVIGHPSRRYAWIMYRSPEPQPERLARHLTLLEKAGFDTNALEYPEHNWSLEAERRSYIENLVPGTAYSYR